MMAMETPNFVKTFELQSLRRTRNILFKNLWMQMTINRQMMQQVHYHQLSGMLSIGCGHLTQLLERLMLDCLVGLC